MSNHDAVISTLRASGFLLDGLEIGRMVRVKRQGHKQKGWYVLHEITLDDGARHLVGSYGYWAGAEKFSDKIRPGRDVRLSAEQRAEIEARHKAATKAEEERRRLRAMDASAKATRVWREYRPGGGQSGYLARKAVGAHGVRWAPDDRDTFAIPIRDNDYKIWGLQIIRGGGRRPGQLEKEYFPAGLVKKGHYHLIGAIVDVVLIAEGYATAASLHEATGLPVVVAFDAGNLKPVAEAIRQAHKKARILICADDDYLTDGNPGVRYANEAALTVDGHWCKPSFTVERAKTKDSRDCITDFNDLACREGAQAVQRIIQAAVAKLPPARGVPTVMVRGAIPTGGGETEDGGAMPSIMSVDDAALRYWGTYGLGGKVLFDEVERRLVAKDDVMNLLPERSWNDLKRHPHWRVSRDSEIGFDPTEKDAQIKCNLFGGWPTTPKAGTCEKLLGLLEYLCANETNEREVYEWVLKWLAYPLQHRGAKMHSAIVVHGGQGTGKSRFFEAYGKIYGSYGRVLGQEALEDKFNADWAEKKLFILADEVLARQDMYHIKNRLKGFITGDTIRVNPKNVAAHNEKNQMNIVFLSNERQPLVLENDDRRHMVIWVPPKLGDDYFNAVNAEIDNGGIEALHHHLLNLDLGDFKPWTRPPMTAAKSELIELGASSEDRFLREWMAGEIEDKDGEMLPFIPCLGSHLYQAYSLWCEQHGERRRGAKDLLSLAGKQPGWTAGKSCPTWTSLVDRTNKNRKMVVPAESAVEGGPSGARHARGAKSKAEWLTACFFAFSQAMAAE
jgi:putative DNA primase/helicase